MAIICKQFFQILGFDQNFYFLIWVASERFMAKGEAAFMATPMAR